MNNISWKTYKVPKLWGNNNNELNTHKINSANASRESSRVKDFSGDVYLTENAKK